MDSSPASSSSDSAKRLREACSECRLMHKGCDRQRPCSRCVQRGVPHKCCDPKDDPRCAPQPKQANEGSSVSSFGGPDRYFQRMAKSNGFHQPVMMFNPPGADLPMPLLMSLMYSGGLNGAAQANPMAAAAAAQMLAQQQQTAFSQMQTSPVGPTQPSHWPFNAPDLSGTSSNGGGMFQSVPSTPMVGSGLTPPTSSPALPTNSGQMQMGMGMNTMDQSGMFYNNGTMGGLAGTNYTPPASELDLLDSQSVRARRLSTGSTGRGMGTGRAIALSSQSAAKTPSHSVQQQQYSTQAPMDIISGYSTTTTTYSPSSQQVATNFSNFPDGGVLMTQSPLPPPPPPSQPLQQQPQQQNAPTPSSYWSNTSDEVPEAALNAAVEAAQQEQEIKKEHPPVILGPEGPVCLTDTRRVGLGTNLSAQDLFFDLDDFFAGDAWQDDNKVLMSPIHDLTQSSRGRGAEDHQNQNQNSSSSPCSLPNPTRCISHDHSMCDPLTGTCYRSTDTDGHTSKKRLLGEFSPPSSCLLSVSSTPQHQQQQHSQSTPRLSDLTLNSSGQPLPSSPISSNPIVASTRQEAGSEESDPRIRQLLEQLRAVSTENLALQQQVRELQTVHTQQQNEFDMQGMSGMTISDDRIHSSVLKNVLDFVADTALHSPRSVVVIRDITKNKVIYINKNMSKVFKYSEADYMRGDVRWYQMVHPNYHKEFLTALERANMAQEPRHSELMQCVITARDGRLFETNLFIGCVQDDSGAGKYRVVVFLPVAEISLDPDTVLRESKPEALS